MNQSKCLNLIKNLCDVWETIVRKPMAMYLMNAAFGVRFKKRLTEPKTNTDHANYYYINREGQSSVLLDVN